VTIFPVISELSHKKNINKQKEYISRSLDYSIMMLAFLMFAVAFTAKHLIKLFYGAKYLDAALPLTILIFCGTFFSLFLLFTTIIAASGKPSQAFFISGVTLVADFVLNYLLVLRYGMLGAAVAATIAMVFGFAISGVYLRRRFGVTVKAGKVAVIIVSAILSCLLFRLLPTNGFWIILSYLACGSAYIALLFLFKVTRRKDIDFVKRLFLGS
jgi:O-antigen/teichoic acid export membrane protein